MILRLVAFGGLGFGSVAMSLGGAAAASPVVPPSPTQAPAPPSQVGLWEAPITWSGIIQEMAHGYLIPAGPHAGSVLFFNEEDLAGGAVGQNSWIFDPQSNALTPLSPIVGAAEFCSGHVALADGDLAVFGGGPTSGQADAQTYIWDAQTGQWSPDTSLLCSRWYPTGVRLSQNRIEAIGGTNAGTCVSSTTHELFTPGLGWSGTWSSFPCGGNACWYERVHLLPTGQLFRSAHDAQSYFLDPVTNALTAGPMSSGLRAAANSLLLIDLTRVRLARVVLVGGWTGAGAPIPSWEFIDHPSPTGTWVMGQHDLSNNGRMNSDTVILPDGKILVVGGSDSTGVGGVPSKKPEMGNPFDWATRWSEMAEQSSVRDYHSGALLLADGRVLSFGGESNSGSLLPPGASHAEIYRPPYLFWGPRPVVNVPPTPQAVGYGSGFVVEATLGSGDRVGSVSLLRPGATTHAFNQEQRYLRLGFGVAAIVPRPGGTNRWTLKVKAPPDANYAPEGWYMLFLVTSSGVPSIGHFLEVQ